MGRLSKKSRLIAGHRTAAGTFGSCKATNVLPAAEKRSHLQYCSDESSDGNAIDMILEEMGEKGFADMVETNRKAAYPKWYARAKGYDGGSRTSNWRKNKNRQLALEAVPMRGINTYFAKKITTTTVLLSECSTAATEAATTVTAVRDERMITSEVSPDECAIAAEEEATTPATVLREHMMWCYGLIEEIVAKNCNFSRRMLVQYIAIQKCLACRIDGMGKVESAKEAAAGLPHGRGFCSSARCIMNWTKVFLETEMLPLSKQGQHQKRTSLLSDEDVSIRIHEWLLQTSKVHPRTPDKLCRWINESLLVEIMGSTCHNISERTVNRWMNTMGYKYGMWKKGIFIDGHERADLVDYRKEFLFRMLSRFKYMQWWEGDDMQRALGRECTS